MVSAAQEMALFFFTGNWSQIHPNCISQSVLKSDMKIKMRMEGDVNGHNFVIEGEGKGNPFE